MHAGPEKSVKTILVVDDSKVMRMMIMRTLVDGGYADANFREAADGDAALEQLQAGGVDIVICDWNMPGLSGLELLERTNHLGIRVRFGFVTSEWTPQMRSLARRHGAEFFVSKPFTPAELLAALARVQ